MMQSLPPSQAVPFPSPVRASDGTTSNRASHLASAQKPDFSQVMHNVSQSQTPGGQASGSEKTTIAHGSQPTTCAPVHNKSIRVKHVDAALLLGSGDGRLNTTQNLAGLAANVVPDVPENSLSSFGLLPSGSNAPRVECGPNGASNTVAPVLVEEVGLANILASAKEQDPSPDLALANLAAGDSSRQSQLLSADASIPPCSATSPVSQADQRTSPANGPTSQSAEPSADLKEHQTSSSVAGACDTTGFANGPGTAGVLTTVASDVIAQSPAAPKLPFDLNATAPTADVSKSTGRNAVRTAANAADQAVPVPATPIVTAHAGINTSLSPEQQGTRATIAKSAVLAMLPPLTNVETVSEAAAKDTHNAATVFAAMGNSQEKAPNSGAHSNSHDASSNTNDPAPSAPSIKPTSLWSADSSAGIDATPVAALLTSSVPPTSISAPISPVSVPSFGAESAPSHSSILNAAQPAQDAPSPAPHTAVVTYGADSASARFVTSAQLFAASSHSEMRVSLDSEKLGAIELRAHLSGDQIGAAILVEKREAHAALTVELPALQQALSEKQLRVDQISLLHGTLGAATGDAGASPRQDQPNPSQGPLASNSSQMSLSAQLVAASGQAGIFDAKGRLSVRA
jgi:hypothetical protein